MPEVCAGVFGPCSNEVTHHLDDPRGVGDPIPLCDAHWLWAVALEKALSEDPEFKKLFSEALDKVRPDRYHRNPVI